MLARKAPDAARLHAVFQRKRQTQHPVSLRRGQFVEIEELRNGQRLLVLVTLTRILPTFGTALPGSDRQRIPRYLERHVFRVDGKRARCTGCRTGALVFLGLAGRHLDASALLRRYRVALRVAGLRPRCATCERSLPAAARHPGADPGRAGPEQRDQADVALCARRTLMNRERSAGLSCGRSSSSTRGARAWPPSSRAVSAPLRSGSRVRRRR